MRRSLSARKMAELLNSALALDPLAVTALIRNVVPCNQALADHPTIPVREVVSDDERHGYVGYYLCSLGILNGLLGDRGDLLAAEVYDYGPHAGSVRRFTTVRRSKMRVVE
jgi:hypothetical protein